ncbi:uncharacterized protein CC84DRAFT_414779 [Paraphaeosphaeria sporulosa]|uniref:Uncharacterized protein n=1 Tax=Paraphaeosphaeria sporulosa TaxID=1460663 RepID=A0A177BXC2_9PLEO|nr:uncharacterized protein CC84DRAFT_414779 [Paraphaeosphaeria sporulosa]OAF99036.1 hypothetical protein CC84DRAFT_414779 [Paraphaeosphaeria sporulosa]
MNRRERKNGQISWSCTTCLHRHSYFSTAYSSLLLGLSRCAVVGIVRCTSRTLAMKRLFPCPLAVPTLHRWRRRRYWDLSSRIG